MKSWFIIGATTAIFFVIANIVLYFYPINKEEYELPEKEIALKETGE